MTSVYNELIVIPDDAPTVSLEALTAAEIAAMEAQEELAATAGSPPAALAGIGALRNGSGEIADELKEARKTIAEMTALLSRRDDELAELKAMLASYALIGLEGAENHNAGEEGTRPLSRPHRGFESGQTRKLIRHDRGATYEYALAPGRMYLGSATDNDVRIEGRFVSRRHARIDSSTKDSVLIDLNSTNGTYVNSRRIARCALRDGDSITIGKLSFSFTRQRETAAFAGHRAERT